MAHYKVAIVGANGLLAGPLINQFLSSKSASYEITVLSRPGGKFNHGDPKVQLMAVDHSDQQSMIDALKGHDYMISLLGGGAIDTDPKLVDAAIAAGVPRVFGNEYSMDYMHPAAEAIAAMCNDPPTFVNKRIAQAERLEKQGKSGQVEWTTIVTSGFIDWGLKTGFIPFYLKDRRATLLDEGKNQVTGCTLEFVAKALVYATTHWEEVKNRRVHVAEVTYTGAGVLALLEKYTGEQFVVDHRTTKDMFEEGFQAYKKGDMMTAARGFLISVNFGGSGATCFIDGLDYGKETIHRKSLEQIVKGVVESTV